MNMLKFLGASLDASRVSRTRITSLGGSFPPIVKCSVVHLIVVSVYIFLWLASAINSTGIIYTLSY